MPTAFFADHLVTGSGAVFSPGWIVIEGTRIAAVGRGEPPTGVSPVSLPRGRLIMPGLVSAHCHLALGSFRGCGDDRPFLDWISNALLPAIQERGADAGIWTEGARRSARELLASGVTLVGENFFRSDAMAVLEETGQHGIYFQEFFGSMAPDESGYIAEVDAIVERIRAQGLTSPVGYSPHTPWTCPPRVFAAVVDRARNEGRRLSFHLDESLEEHEFISARSGPLERMCAERGTLDRYRFGVTPTALMAELGALGPQTVVAHAVQVTSDDIAILARTGTHVAHCPRSNLKLAEGVAPVGAMIEAGVNVALGVDSAASNSRLDMFEEMRTALLCQRGLARRVGAMDAATLLRMATINGARALGFENLTGTLEVGKSADFVILDVSTTRHAPIRDPLATIVFTCGPEDVEAVHIGGMQHYRRGEA